MAGIAKINKISQIFMEGTHANGKWSMHKLWNNAHKSKDID